MTLQQKPLVLFWINQFDWFEAQVWNSTESVEFHTWASIKSNWWHRTHLNPNYMTRRDWQITSRDANWSRVEHNKYINNVSRLGPGLVWHLFCCSPISKTKQYNYRPKTDSFREWFLHPIPTNMTRCPCVVLMLGQRRRRWPNNKPAHGSACGWIWLAMTGSSIISAPFLKHHPG